MEPPVRHGASSSAPHGRMPGLQRLPQSQTMNRSFQGNKHQQQPLTAQVQPPPPPPDSKRDIVLDHQNSESEMDRDVRLDDWNRRLLEVIWVLFWLNCPTLYML